MPKLTIEDLKHMREKARGTVNLRDGVGRAKITVHMGTCGIASGARDVMNALLSEIENRNIQDVIVTTSGCAGLCSREPMATVELPGSAPIKYIDLNDAKIKKIFEEHILSGNIVAQYALAIGSERTY